MLGSQSALLVLGVVLLLFGGKKLPELAGALGRSMREFKKAVETDHADQAGTSPESGPAISPPAAERTCGACKAPLDAEWTHCPRCGIVAPQPVSGP
jgi:sec-independent protein translocase protein TatA